MDSSVETLRMSLSGLILQRRSDGLWRCLGEEQHADELAGAFSPGPDEWTSADAPIGRGGKAEWGPGSHDDEETWWVLYGDSREGLVSVTLADGHTPPIMNFGPLWICEWVSKTQAAVVRNNKGSYKMFHRVPAYRTDQEAEDDAGSAEEGRARGAKPL